MKLKFTIVIVFFLFLAVSCDTPRSMAWNHYYYAQSQLEEGDVETARNFANIAASFKKDSLLILKVKELQKEIDSIVAIKDSLK